MSMREQKNLTIENLPSSQDITVIVIDKSNMTINKEGIFSLSFQRRRGLMARRYRSLDGTHLL